MPGFDTYKAENADTAKREAEALREREKECLLLAREAVEHDFERENARAAARTICSFLLDPKMKSRFAALLKGKQELRQALFGRLDPHPLALIRLLTAVLKLDDPALTRETLETMKNNPFNTPGAKPWAGEWSLDDVLTETLKAPPDYLALTEENKQAVLAYFEEGTT